MVTFLEGMVNLYSFPSLTSVSSAPSQTMLRTSLPGLAYTETVSPKLAVLWTLMLPFTVIV